jgi:hypothetical protein
MLHLLEELARKFQFTQEALCELNECVHLMYSV